MRIVPSASPGMRRLAISCWVCSPALSLRTRRSGHAARATPSRKFLLTVPLRKRRFEYAAPAAPSICWQESDVSVSAGPFSSLDGKKSSFLYGETLSSDTGTPDSCHSVTLYPALRVHSREALVLTRRIGKNAGFLYLLRAFDATAIPYSCHRPNPEAIELQKSSILATACPVALAAAEFARSHPCCCPSSPRKARIRRCCDSCPPSSSARAAAAGNQGRFRVLGLASVGCSGRTAILRC